MDTTITIIEGPPPVFEPVQDGWALGLSEGPKSLVNAVTKLRTFNGPKLVERCYRAWRNYETMHLLYRNDLGLEQKAPIQAARSVETEEGHVLLLWVYLDPEFVEFQTDRSDDDGLDDGFER
jgi:hypothetical protein